MHWETPQNVLALLWLACNPTCSVSEACLRISNDVKENTKSDSPISPNDFAWVVKLFGN